ncbi:MAG: ATP-binding protein [Magnetococcus sp. YQC-9]
MLLRFGIENMYSFRDYQEISLVAPKSSQREEIRGLLPTNGAIKDPVLPILATYGANASGKSNLLVTLVHFLKAISDSHSTPGMPDITHSPFLLDDTSSRAPSRMDCDVIIDGCRHHYGFRLDSQRILEEWLYAFSSNNRRRVLFHRSLQESDPYYFGTHLKGNLQGIKSQTRPDSLFLSTAGINNHATLNSVWNYFRSQFMRNINIDHRSTLSNDIIKLETSALLRNFVIALLREADTGISDIAFKKLPDELNNAITIELENSGLTIENKKIIYEILPKQQIDFIHQTNSGAYNLPYGLESRGTQTILSIAIQLHTVLERGSVMIVDELEASLHPYVAARLIELFQNPETNPHRAQLLFTTHHPHLMNSLAPAQIVICEKNRQGATEIYPLTALQPRKGENLANGYLKGRYGGIPYMGSIFNHLPREEKQVAPEEVAR